MDINFDAAKLKSGTDLRGVASGVGATLTPPDAVRVGCGFGNWLARRFARAVVVAVGRDSRLSGEALADGLTRGLCAASVSVIDVGMSTTPAMFEIVNHADVKCDAAVMVTASHLPAERNGFKFILASGGLSGGELDEIIKDINEAGTPPVPAAACPVKLDFLPYYLRKLEGMVERKLGADGFSGLRVAVDAGNGGGGFYARWLKSLGADIAGSINLEPDGSFPAHPPNPEDGTAIAAISGAVVNAGADIGVIFDADCDRAALVSRDGTPLNKERLIALCAAMLTRPDDAEAANGRDDPVWIVTDSVTSPSFTSFIEELGGRHRRWKRGYKNVITEAKRLNDEGKNCQLAMETSGHAAFRDNRFLDDGMYLATLLLIECVRLKRMNLELESLISGLCLPAVEAEARIPFEIMEARSAALDKAYAAYKDDGEYVTTLDEPEGLRCERKDGAGWFILRASLHDPLLVLNVRAKDNETAEAIRQACLKAIDIQAVASDDTH